MSNPRHLLHLVELYGPATCHVEEITKAIQIPLNSRIHLILLDKRDHATLCATANRATHLKGSSTLRRRLGLAVKGVMYGNRKRSERRQLRVQLIDPVLQNGDVLFGELSLLDLVRSTIDQRERNDSLR